MNPWIILLSNTISPIEKHQDELIEIARAIANYAVAEIDVIISINFRFKCEKKRQQQQQQHKNQFSIRILRVRFEHGIEVHQ